MTDNAYLRIRALRAATIAILGVAAPPGLAQTFTDVTLAAGIAHVHTTNEKVADLPGTFFLAGGVAAADFDGDGWTDLIFPRLNDVDIYYRNRGDGTFEARTAAAGFTDVTLTNGVVAGDIDNDGDADVYMTTTAGTRNYLYLNDGAGVFTEVAIERGAALVSDSPHHRQGATFGDYDNDGYLDLMTADWGVASGLSQSRLLRNRGAAQPGAFEDVTAAAGVDVYRTDNAYRFQPRFIDLDRDGHLDLAIAADFYSSQLFWNNGDGTFTDGTLPAGVGTDYNGMGSTFGDYDGDGDLDWFITNITADPTLPPTGFGGWNRLYRNDGNRQFTDVTQAAGVRDSRWSWGTTFFDYDNDGDVDLIATNGYNGAGWRDDRTFLWNNNAGVYTDVSDAAGITDRRQGRGLAHLDYDRDGDLDIVIVNNRAAPILYRNDGGNANHWLRISLEGTLSNRDAIGAFITVYPDLTNAGARSVWEVDGGSSFLSCNERVAHFGLGPTAGEVDLVVVAWPSGLVERYCGLAANQSVHLVEGAGAACGCAGPAIDQLRLFAMCISGAERAADCVGGRAGDCDDDGDVDLRDFATLQRLVAGE